MEKPQIIQTYCPFNLGDHVYNFFLFYHINHILIEYNIIVEYRCRKEYHEQLREFIPQPLRIHILPYETSPQDDIGIRMHIASPHLPTNLDTRKHTHFDGYYLEYYEYLLQEFKLPVKVSPTPYTYTDFDLLLRYELLPEKYKNIDVLVINSTPRSGQYLAFFRDKQNWGRFCHYLVQNLHLNVVTTEKIPGIKCTADDSLSLKNIGALSTRAKIIIAISTGPLSACFNTFTLENIQRIYMFHDNNTYITPKVVKKNTIMEIDIRELYQLCHYAQDI